MAVASMASASVDAMSRRSAALCSLLGPCPVCPLAVDHRAPSYLQTASARNGLPKMRSIVVVRAAQGSDSSVRRARACRSGLEDTAPPREPEQRASKTHTPPIHTGPCRQGLRTLSKFKAHCWRYLQMLRRPRESSTRHRHRSEDGSRIKAEAPLRLAGFAP